MTTYWIRKHLPIAAVCCFAFFLFQQCTKIEDVSLGYSIGGLGVNSADTFSVKASTFLLDPLPTANQGTLLLGAVHDASLGTTKMTTSFRLAQPNVSADLANDVQFDSLTLRLFYNRYAYGDTTKSMTLNVHRLTESIEPKELPIALEDDEYPVFVSGETLYANQRFAYDETPLGTTRFLPKPFSKTDTVSIKLDQALGEELFQMVRNKDTKLTIEDEYLEFLKGLAIVPEDDAQAIIGFKDSISFSLHYSYERQSDGKRISDEFTFAMGSGSYQYNTVESDRSGTVLADLSYTNQEIASAATGQETFIQGATGIVSRISFPYLRETLATEPTAINRAQLIIETDQSYLGDTPPPDSLIIMVANKYGTPTSLLQNSAGSSIVAIYQNTNNSGGLSSGKYVFNVTDYIRELITTTTYDDTKSLLLSLPTSNLLSSINSLHIAKQNDNSPAIKLNILYIKTQ